jgi:hypothetical protein
MCKAACCAWAKEALPKASSLSKPSAPNRTDAYRNNFMVEIPPNASTLANGYRPAPVTRNTRRLPGGYER